MTPQELQSLRNLGNEAEAAADEIERLRGEVERLQAAHDHQYGVAGTFLREAERVGRENDALRALLRDRCQTCKGTGVVMGDSEINASCQYDCPDCAALREK